MDVILLERINKLGAIGDIVSVRNGYARNFLIPQGKALLATMRNRQRFEDDRAAILARNEESRKAAGENGVALEGTALTLIRQAGDTGQLYGSVSARDIVEAADEKGHKISRQQIMLDMPIKAIGVYEVNIRLHPEVEIKISINVARSPDEAERQASGEDIIESARVAERALVDEQAKALAEAAAEAQAERGDIGEEI